MSRSYYGWAPYVSVAGRRAKAAGDLAALRGKGQAVAPVIIATRAIATTFWGRAWCDNLECYRDLAYRLERGRSYVRNGAILDLRVMPRKVTALVSGTEVYRVEIKIADVPAKHWQSICRDCTGGIDSLVDLLRGRLSEGVMERICRPDTGLFPRPAEIQFSCSCPDYASMCKHVAAALYGVGARLDEKPELLFRLRAVDESDLLGQLEAGALLATTRPDAGKILQADDMSALFGIEMASEEPAGEPVAAPATARRKLLARPKAGPGRPSEPPQPVADPTGGRRAEPARSRRKQRGVPESAIELTPDGYVKWWK